MFIHLASALSSGNNSSITLSVSKMSFGSPDKAAHLNGPFPSQNKGLIYAGTNPGKSNAFSTPFSFALSLKLFP